jgi:hypothetical protein
MMRPMLEAPNAIETSSKHAHIDHPLLSPQGVTRVPEHLVGYPWQALET